MNWRRQLGPLLVVLTLAGCAPGVTGQAGAPEPAYQQSEPPETPAGCIEQALGPQPLSVGLLHRDNRPNTGSAKNQPARRRRERKKQRFKSARSAFSTAYAV